MSDPSATSVAPRAHPVRGWLIGVAIVPAAVLLWIPFVLALEWSVHAVGGRAQLFEGSMNWSVPLAVVVGVVVAFRAIAAADHPWAIKALAMLATLLLQAFAALVALALIFSNLR